MRILSTLLAVLATAVFVAPVWADGHEAAEGAEAKAKSAATAEVEKKAETPPVEAKPEAKKAESDAAEKAESN